MSYIEKVFWWIADVFDIAGMWTRPHEPETPTDNIYIIYYIYYIYIKVNTASFPRNGALPMPNSVMDPLGSVFLCYVLFDTNTGRSNSGGRCFNSPGLTIFNQAYWNRISYPFKATCKYMCLNFFHGFSYFKFQSEALSLTKEHALKFISEAFVGNGWLIATHYPCLSCFFDFNISQIWKKELYANIL